MSEVCIAQNLEVKENSFSNSTKGIEPSVRSCALVSVDSMCLHSSKEACFHTNQSNAQVSRKMQKLLAGKLFAHHYLALHAEPNQVENCLTNIDPHAVYLYGMPPLYASYTTKEAADHPISDEVITDE